MKGEVWNNGVFTHCFLKGLEEGHTSVNRLKDYVSRDLEALTNGLQKPKSKRENLEYDWRL